MSGSSSSSSAVLPGRKTVDYESLLAEHLAKLTPEAFPTTTWTKQAITRSFITVSKFIDAIKILTTISDDILLGKILHRGISDGFWESNNACTVVQLYKFCVWCRSAEGSAYINDLRRIRSLEKKAVGGLSIEDVGLLGALEQQLGELAREEKEIRASTIIIIQKEDALKQLRLKLKPASDFEHLDGTELGKRCYALYSEECRRLNRPEADLNGQLMEDVRYTYGNQAICLHKAEFMRDELRRKMVKHWAEERIRELSRRGDKRLATTLSTYLTAAGCRREQPAVNDTGAQARGEDGGRQTPSTGAEGDREVEPTPEHPPPQKKRRPTGANTNRPQ